MASKEISLSNSIGGREDELSQSVLGLERAGINLLALDFDNTLISHHTYGRWPDTRPATELAQLVRPLFLRLIPKVMDTGILVGIVTFSPQVQLIRDVLNITLPQYAHRIAIRGAEPGDNFKEGKQKFMAHVASELQGQAKKEITRASTLLVDDDIKNIRIALNNNVQAIWFDPSNPDGLVTNLIAL